MRSIELPPRARAQKGAGGPSVHASTDGHVKTDESTKLTSSTSGSAKVPASRAQPDSTGMSVASAARARGARVSSMEVSSFILSPSSREVGGSTRASASLLSSEGVERGRWMGWMEFL